MDGNENNYCQSRNMLTNYSLYRYTNQYTILSRDMVPLPYIKKQKKDQTT